MMTKNNTDVNRESNRKVKVAFLFGAGAESHLGLPLGHEFLKKTFFIDDFGESIYANMLGEKFKGNYFKKDTENDDGSNKFYEYSRHNLNAGYTHTRMFKKLISDLIANQSNNNLLYQHIAELHDIFSKSDLSEMRKKTENIESKHKLISRYEKLVKEIKLESKTVKPLNENMKEKEIWQEIIKLLDGNSNSKSKEDNVKNKSVSVFIDLIKGNVVDKIEKNSILSQIVKEEENGKYKDDVKYKVKGEIGIGGLLDGYFHTIIDPTKYSSTNFSKIFNHYWLSYFSILEKVMLNKKEKFKDYFDGEKLKKTTLADLDKIIQVLYDTEDKDILKTNKPNYYEHIANRIESDNSIELSGVITTNYYRYCELMFGDNSIVEEKICYLNGMLKLMEFPEMLKIMDISKPLGVTDRDDYEKKLFFPFIFVQSFLKPIVSKYQISAFHNMSKILNSADVLVVLGYGINEDDNHINSFLREFALNKKLINVHGCGERPEVHEKLAFGEDQIVNCEINYEASIDISVDTIFEIIYE